MDETIREIKHQFMAFRNGIIADTLRKAGYPYSVIFGLNLPQLSQIAKDLDHNIKLASTLWQDKNVRESRLLATYLFPTDIDEATACELIDTLQTNEEADMLAFRLLKRLPYAPQLVEKYSSDSNPIRQHLSAILASHLGQ
jgi:3-methyladenine DNA glycosylase AlkD